MRLEVGVKVSWREETTSRLPHTTTLIDTNLLAPRRRTRTTTPPAPGTLKGRMPRPAPPVAVTPSATPHEAAAITAAIAQFRRDTAAPPPPAPRRDAWQRAALLEATGREPDAPSPWGDPVAWG